MAVVRRVGVLGLDLGTKYIKVSLFEPDENGKGTLVPYPTLFNGQPRSSDVRISRVSLQRPDPVVTRSSSSSSEPAPKPRLQVEFGIGGNRNAFVFLRNAKRFLFRKVDVAAAAQDLGFPAAAGVADEDGFLGIQVPDRGVLHTIWLTDVFASIIFKLLYDLDQSGTYRLAGLAITMPVETGAAGRARAEALVQQELGKLLGLWPFPGVRPFVEIVPESLAAHWAAWNTEGPDGVQAGTRSMVVDMGHGTLDVTIATVGAALPSDIVNTGDCFCGVKDLHDKVLDLVTAKLVKAKQQPCGVGSWLRRFELEDDDSEKVDMLKRLLAYVRDAVEKATAAESPDEVVSDSASPLYKDAPVKAGEVWDAAEPLAQTTEQVVRRALTINRLGGRMAPTKLQLVGGGALIPAVREAAMRAVGPNVQVFNSTGGNRDMIATGAAKLMAGHLKQGTRAGMSDGMWLLPLGSRLAVWHTFDVGKVKSMTLPKLQELKDRILAAAGVESEDGSTIVPDAAQRAADNAVLQQFIADRIQGRPNSEYQFTPERCEALQAKAIPIYIVVADTATSLPWAAKYPYKLCSPDGRDNIRLRLVLLDPLQQAEDVVAGRFVMAPPPQSADSSFLRVRLAVDAEQHLSCKAEVYHSRRRKSVSHPVQTEYDRFAALRHSQEQRLQQLSLEAQALLLQTLADASAVPAPAAGGLPAAAPRAAGRRAAGLQPAAAAGGAATSGPGTSDSKRQRTG